MKSCSSPSTSRVSFSSCLQVDARSALLVVAHGGDRKSFFILLVCALSDFSFFVRSIQLSCHHCQSTIRSYSQVSLSHWKLACSCSILWKKTETLPPFPHNNLLFTLMPCVNEWILFISPRHDYV